MASTPSVNQKKKKQHVTVHAMSEYGVHASIIRPPKRGDTAVTSETGEKLPLAVVGNVLMRFFHQEQLQSSLLVCKVFPQPIHRTKSFLFFVEVFSDFFVS